MSISPYLKSRELPFVVFITGAAVLVVEVAAVRILSPYFGNTIYTVSGVISVILAALSLGYYAGGRMADRRPEESLFYGMVLVGGLSIILLQLLAFLFLPLLGYGLPLAIGPLVAALFLFFVPGFVLGTLSPFAIALQKLRVPDGIGTVSGEIFFWSTCGSIVGSLLTGFVLVPSFGVDRIIVATGALLLVFGAAMMLRSSKDPKMVSRAILLLVLGLGLALFLVSRDADAGVVYSRDGVYEKITVKDTTYKERPARMLLQDRSSSAAMFLDDGALVFDYTKYYALYRLAHADVRRALVIGGGAYSIPKELLRELPEAEIEVAEIEPSLLEIAQRYFELPRDPRLHNIVADGRRMLHDTQEPYDLIFGDAYYSLYSIPGHLVTEEFFSLVKSRLTPNGVFVGNFIGDLSHASPSFILSEMRTFRRVFPNSYFFATQSPHTLEPQNIVFMGIVGEKKIDLSSVSRLYNTESVLAGLEGRVIDPERFHLGMHPILTDNYAPVEYLASRVLTTGARGSHAVLSGDEMMARIEEQLALGPRHVTAPGHARLQGLLTHEMQALADDVLVESWSKESKNGDTYQLKNIIGRFAPERSRRIILAAHYDTKRYADKDWFRPGHPMPGANDGASGVAVLLEIARYLKETPIESDVGVDIIFFDGEEGEEELRQESDWHPIGSQYFRDHIRDVYPDTKPEIGIVLDMVCDKNLEILQEPSSVRTAPDAVKTFWEIGEEIAPQVFSTAESMQIYDDHTSLQQAGIPSILVVDFSYPPFHTTRDMADKCSGESLEAVAKTVFSYVSSLAR